jgi:hypothetical protein
MITQIETRKYDSNYRKKLVNKINKLKNKEYYIDVYNIIISDIGTNFSSNINGLFLNVNLLSNKCIEELNIYLTNKLKEPNNIINSIDISVSYYKSNEYTNDNDVKLSNHEKNIIKKFRANEVNN